MSRKPADDYIFEREAVPEWEELFNRKCDMLRHNIAAIVYETVFTTEERYSCKKCKCRIKAWIDDKEYCIKCSPLPSWTDDMRKRITAILQFYPTKEGCNAELKARGKNPIQPEMAKKKYNRRS